jgi:hypothetical protein
VSVERKATVLMGVFRAYGLAALLVLLLCRMSYGQTPFIMFLAWSSIGASFLWLCGSAVQAFCGSRGEAAVNAVFAIAAVFAAAHLMPYMVR